MDQQVHYSISLLNIVTAYNFSKFVFCILEIPPNLEGCCLLILYMTFLLLVRLSFLVDLFKNLFCFLLHQ